MQAPAPGMVPPKRYPGLTKAADYNAPDEPDVYYANCQRNYARVAATDDLQGAIAAAFAKRIGANRVYVLHDSDLYGRGVAEIFATTARDLGRRAWSEALRFASVAAALTCTQAGANPLRRAEVEASFERHGGATGDG